MKNLNELFKKKLAEQQFDGKEQYWAQLEKKLNESAQEKVVVVWYKKWLLPVIAIVVMGALALLFTMSNDKKNTTQLEAFKVETIEQTVSAPEVVSNVKVISQENQSANNTSAQIADASNDANSNKNQNKLSTKAADLAGINNSSQNNNDKSITQNPNNLNNYSNKKNTISANNISLKTNKTLGKEPVLSNTDDLLAIATTPKNSVENKSSNIKQATENQPDEYVSPVTSTAVKALDFSQIEMPLALISPKALSALFYDELAPNVATNIVPVNTSKAKSKFSLSVYGGAMLSMKNLFTSEGNTADYIKRRKQEEVKSIKPNVGVDIELKRGHWTLTSGINFHQQGEKRNYSDQFKRIVPYDSLVVNINNNSAWLVDSSMFYAVQYNNIITSYDTTITYYDQTSGLFYTAQLPVNVTQGIISDTNFYYSIDSTFQSNIDTVNTNYALKKQVVVLDPNQVNLKGRNTFSYVEVPLLIGYEWGIRRWRLSVKTGIGFGVLTHQQSFYLTTDESEIAPVSTDVYTKVVYNGIFRAGLHYNFTPQFGIDIVPFSRLNINNITNKNADFRQKYTNVGLQIGFNYKL